MEKRLLISKYWMESEEFQEDIEIRLDEINKVYFDGKLEPKFGYMNSPNDGKLFVPGFAYNGMVFAVYLKPVSKNVIEISDLVDGVYMYELCNITSEPEEFKDIEGIDHCSYVVIIGLLLESILTC